MRRVLLLTDDQDQRIFHCVETSKYNMMDKGVWNIEFGVKLFTTIVLKTSLK